MTKKTLKTRVDDLEAGKGDLPQILACESMFERGVYRVTEVGDPDHESESMTWEEVQEKYADRQIIRLYYVDNWRST